MPRYQGMAGFEEQSLNGRKREGGRGRERERERGRERAIRMGTFVTKKGHFCNKNRGLL